MHSPVVYPAHAVGLETHVGSRKLGTSCAMRMGNCWGSAPMRVLRLARRRPWSFLRSGIARLERSMHTVRRYLLYTNFTFQNQFWFSCHFSCRSRNSSADFAARAGPFEGCRNCLKTTWIWCSSHMRLVQHPWQPLKLSLISPIHRHLHDLNKMLACTIHLHPAMQQGPHREQE